MNTPAEVLETAYPLQVARYELREDSGGAGEFRGGLGIRRDITVRDHTATFSLLADRHTHHPYGLLGGTAGSSGSAVSISPNGDTKRLPQKSTHKLDSGTTVSIRTPGAGGYGDPSDRSKAAIEQDLRSEKVSIEQARESYRDTIVDEIINSDSNSIRDGGPDE